MDQDGAMDDLQHRTHAVNGIRLHTVEAGDGPLVVLVHGFPESWYSWRHQLPALAGAGYRAVAIDVRGYGRSSAPMAVEEYRMVRLVGDLVGLLDALEADDAVLVGHDWGAPIVWNTALLRPQRVRGVAGLSVPYNPRGPEAPLTTMRRLAGDDLFYIEYFQEPGVAEAEIEQDVAAWLAGFSFTISGEADLDAPPVGLVPRGARLQDRFQRPRPGQMAWMGPDDLAFYVHEFERTGFTGGLNRYRNVDRDWADLAAWAGAPIEVPALFIGGDRDGPTLLGRRAIERFDETLPRLWRSEILPGCGHWTQQEQPRPTTELLLGFLEHVG
jgi:pimeloyl-ACP methyl ester carboxylesterase